MELVWLLLLFAVGLVLIIKGGDFFVDAATWMAEASGIPKFLIGATVVSLATTLPEMFVSIFAAMQGSVDMAVGNAVGSVTANASLIMGVALIFMPTVIKRKKYLFQSLAMLGAALVIVVCGLMGQVNMLFSVVLLIIFAVSMGHNIISARQSSLKTSAEREAREKPEGKVVALNLVKFAVGAAGIVIGADFLVDSGSQIAAMLGVSERIIGVTVIALGTSLPELVTTITAISKKQASLSVGNIIGANIMDLTLIMPLSALVSGQALPISQSAGYFDLPACLLVGVVGLVPALVAKKFMRWQGFLLVGLYVAYIAVTSFVIV